MRWSKKHVLYGSGLITLLILICLFLNLMAAIYIQANHNDLDAQSSAGQYLNFIVGIPLTLLAALIGAWISYQIAQFNKSKDDFSILDFVDKVSSPVVEAQSRIIATIEVVADAATLMKEDVEAAFRKVSQTAPHQSTVEKLSVIEQELAEPIADNLARIGNSLTVIGTQYTNLSLRMHSAMFLKERRKRIESTSPLVHLKRTLPDSTAYIYSTSTIPSMVERLIWLHSQTTSRDLTRAYLFLPDQFTCIELSGMVLFSPYFALTTPITLHDGRIVIGYTVNVGAAFLTTLYASLPDKDDMLCSFRDLMEVPAVAMRYLEKAGPSVHELALPNIDQAMAAILDDPNRLIVLQTRNDAFFYNPAEHGDIRRWELKQEGGQ
jgi:hypothetical protein